MISGVALAVCLGGCYMSPTIRAFPVALLSPAQLQPTYEPALHEDELKLAGEILAGARPHVPDGLKLANRLYAAEPEAPGAVLAACIIALDTLATTKDPAEVMLARHQANDRLALLLANWPRTKDGDPAPCGFSWHGHRLVVGVDWAESDCVPRYYGKWTPASMIGVSGFRQRHVDEGIGVPMVASRTNPGTEPIDAYYPPEGIVRPVTAVLRTEGGLRLIFKDPYCSTTEQVGERTEPLAADVTAAYATLLSRVKLRSEGRMAFIEPAKFKRGAKVALLQPYDPKKIPIVMVHGLRSSPYTWRELTNAIWGDPQLRTRYQVWHYFYSTGFSALFSAAEFRRQLSTARDFFEKEAPSPQLDRFVLIGHSMGGILCRTMVTNPGEALFHAGWSGQEDVLDHLPKDEAEILRSALFFDAKPWVSRVVFVSTPHRGSEWADNWVARWVADKIDLPQPFTDVWKGLDAINNHALSPFLENLVSKRKATSVTLLSPSNPVLRKLAELPIAPGVPYHSIMGDRGLGDGPLSSDGVVTYASAHLDGAASEKIVPSGHNAQDSPEGVAEIVRILKLNLTESDTEVGM